MNLDDINNFCEEIKQLYKQNEQQQIKIDILNEEIIILKKKNKEKDSKTIWETLQNKLKEKGLPWEKAKAFDDAAIVGKWSPLNSTILSSPIRFSLHKNGVMVQDGDSSLMIFPLATILESITEYFTIYPGDLIFTGTPVGVGPTHKGDIFEGYFEANQVFSVKVNP